MGQRALGMGGAFTGLANDPSAAFYNPAGLARIEETTLSASLSLAAVDRLTVEDGYRTPAGDGDLTYRGHPALPIFIGLVRQVGRKDAHGFRHHSIAVSTFTIDDRSLGIDTRRHRVAEDGMQWLTTLYGRHDQTQRWYGLSYAYRLKRNYALGASLFLRHGRASALEERLDLSMGPSDASGMGSDPHLRFHNVRVSEDTKSFVARLAFLYTTTRLRVGVMFQPPSVHLTGKGEIRDRLVTAEAMEVDPAQGTYLERTVKDLATRDPLPWELRAGVAVQPNTSLQLDLDLSVDGRGGTLRSPWPLNATGLFMPADEEVRLGLRSYERVPTVNAALGAEYVIREQFTLQGGAFTDFSAAHRLPETAPEQRPDHIHRFGLSGSVGFGAKGVDLALGAVGRLGYGQALSPAPEGAKGAYLRSNAHEYTLFVFLTGARTAVAKLADVAIDKINERREEAAAAQEAAAEEPKPGDQESPGEAEQPADEEAPAEPAKPREEQPPAEQGKRPKGEP
jgi:long-chain fatty acid transport protein